MSRKRKQKPPVVARVDMTRRTYEELTRTLRAWTQVYGQPGAVFMKGSFYCVHTDRTVMGILGQKLVMDPADVAATLNCALVVLGRAGLTSSTATVNLGDASQEELEALYWTGTSCRVKHAGQGRALERVGRSALEYMGRPPLMKLADCAE